MRIQICDKRVKTGNESWIHDYNPKSKIKSYKLKYKIFPEKYLTTLNNMIMHHKVSSYKKHTANQNNVRVLSLYIYIYEGREGRAIEGCNDQKAKAALSKCDYYLQCNKTPTYSS